MNPDERPFGGYDTGDDRLGVAQREQDEFLAAGAQAFEGDDQVLSTPHRDAAPPRQFKPIGAEAATGSTWNSQRPCREIRFFQANSARPFS